MSELIELSRIRTDGGTQPRAAIDTDLVQQYALDMAKGDPFPPLVVFFDGADYWLADGFHRFHAGKANGKGGMPALVRQGTQRDAILYSVGANADHGWQRTAEDKRRAVQRLLNDPEWSAWSDREIGRHCRVDGKTVAALRPAAMTAEFRSEPQARTYTTRHGTTATMDTSKIGARPQADRAVFDGTPAGADLRAQSPLRTDPTSAPVFDSSDFHANRQIHAQVQAIFAAHGALPDPITATNRYPPILRQTDMAERARELAEWFSAFASAWEEINGEQHVAA